MKRLLLVAALLMSLGKAHAIPGEDGGNQKWLEVVNHATSPVTALVLFGLDNRDQSSFNLEETQWVKPGNGWTFTFNHDEVPGCIYNAAVMLSTGEVYWSEKPVNICAGSRITLHNESI